MQSVSPVFEILLIQVLFGDEAVLRYLIEFLLEFDCLVVEVFLGFAGHGILLAEFPVDAGPGHFHAAVEVFVVVEDHLINHLEESGIDHAPRQYARDAHAVELDAVFRKLLIILAWRGIKSTYLGGCDAQAVADVPDQVAEEDLVGAA